MISAVVCTYNRADVLAKTLDSFLAQTCLEAVEHELLVIDNNSTDRTRDTVEERFQKPTVRYIFEPKQGLCAARNRGVLEARGDVVALLDDDVIIDPQWLMRLRQALDETHADVIGGRSYLILAADPPEWFGPDFRALLSEVNLGVSRIVVPRGRGLAGLNLAFQRETLSKAGRFDETLDRRGRELLGGGETMMMRKIQAAGGVIMYDPDVVVGHMIGVDRLTWDYFVRLSVGIGKSMAMWDRTSTFGGRAKAVFRGVGALRWRCTAWMREVVRRGTLYERRRAWRRVLAMRSRLAREIALLWRTK